MIHLFGQDETYERAPGGRIPWRRPQQRPAPRVSDPVRPIAILVAAIAAACALAGPAKAAPARFFGVVYDRDVSEASAAVQDQQFVLMRKTGVRTVRRVFSWAAAEPDQGAPPNFAETDALVARAARNDIEILPIVMYAPVWARTSADDAASPPRSDDDYVAFLNALIARYGPVGSFWTQHPDVPKHPLRTWQVWNEPQLRYQWADADWETSYGKLLGAAHDAIKKADPGAKVVLAGATNFAWNALESLYKKGRIKGEFDIAALHPYTGSAGRVLTAVKLFRAVLKKHGDSRKPVWITELAWPASKGRVRAPKGLAALPTTDRGMATRLTRAYRLLRKTHAVQRAYWYTWASAYKKSDGIFGFTGLQRYDPAAGRFTAMPALRAFRTIAR
jgi:Glycosyl hydrolase catalytic core